MSSRMSPEMKAKIAQMVAILDSHPDTRREEILESSPFQSEPIVFEIMQRPKFEVQTHAPVRNYGPKPWGKKAKRGRL